MEWISHGSAGTVVVAGAVESPASRSTSLGLTGSPSLEAAPQSRSSAASARVAFSPGSDRRKLLDGTGIANISSDGTGLANITAAASAQQHCETGHCSQAGCLPQHQKPRLAFAGQPIVDANGNDVAVVPPNGCQCCPASVRKHDAIATTAATTIDDGSQRRTSGTSTSSFQALQHAVLTLYRQDDFTLEKIGEGFFSDVFKVVHRATGEVMALKMNRNGCNRTSMLREVELMNRLSHPNVLRFRGVCVHGGQLHAVVEYVNGGSLHQILVCDRDSSRLPWQERIRLSIDIAKGMNYLHSQGYIHRDLTSRNVLVSEKEGTMTAIVSDFGLATKIPSPDDADRHLSVVGSPYWMAPECLRGDDYNQTADVFSYGIILCEMIAMIDADPDSLPRTENFGLDYIAFCNLIEDCPLHFLYLAFRCAQMDPPRRPTFREAEDCLQGVILALQQQQQEELSMQQEAADALMCSAPSGAPLLQASTTTPSPAQATPSRSSRRFSIKDMHSHKRSKSAGQLELSELLADESKDLLLLSPSSGGASSAASLQVVARRMTKEDPFYTPAPANTNPFASSQRFKDGHKLLASCEADEEADDDSGGCSSSRERSTGDVDDVLSLGFLLPSSAVTAAAAAAATLLRRQSLRHTASLPELSDGAAQASLAVGSDSASASPEPIVTERCCSTGSPSSGNVGCAAAAASCGIRLTHCADEPPERANSAAVTPTSPSSHTDSLSADASAAAAAAAAAALRRSSTGQLQLPSSHYKQLSLECAMLFCGLDLIRSQRSRTGEASDLSTPSDAASGKSAFAAGSPAAVSPVDDLECEFEDDLKDVLRSCGAAPPASSSRQQSLPGSSSRATRGAAAAPTLRSGAFGKSGPSDDDDDDGECCIAGGSESVSPAAPLQLGSGADGRSEVEGAGPSRYVNPTLAEKRRQLRQVRGRSSSSGSGGGCTPGTANKLEQLQLKLNHLRQLNEAEKKQRRRLSSVM